MEDREDRIKRLEAERDAYLRALYALTRKDVPPLTAEELEELKRSTCSLAEVIQEIEGECGPTNG